MTTSWTWEWAFRNLIAEFLMPPGIWLILILCAVFFLRNKSNWKNASILVASGMIWMTSTQAFYLKLTEWSDVLMHWPSAYSLRPPIDSKAAIVILGGGRTKGALEYPEYNFQDLSRDSLMRLRLGAHFAKATRLPILVTGGAPDRTSSLDISEAQVMAQILEKEWNIQPRWQERASQTTQENAQFSKDILKHAQIEHIYLVTHVWHMPRAAAIFERYGFRVTPVPLGFEKKNDLTPLDYYPSGSGFSKTRNVWHEILGMLWYRLRY